MSTTHAWCAGSGMETAGVAFTGWPFNLPAHHTYCDLLLGSPAVTLSGDKKQAAHELLLNWGKVKGPRTVAGAEGARGMADTKETEQSAQEPKSLRLKFIKLTVQ